MLQVHFKAVSDPFQVPDPEALEVFQTDWGIYRKVVQSNSMHHRELSDILRGLLDQHFDGPFVFIDLACGDASLARTVLNGTRVARYDGLDLSRPALHCAVEVMKDVPYDVDLAEEEMVAGITARANSADMIWCGFSIHHLQAKQKQEMLKAVCRALRPGGIFVCAEPVCKPGETRADYIARWHRELRERFRVLPDGEFEHFWEHIRSNDIPETPETWIAMGEKAGFKRSREIFRMPGDLFCAAFLYER